MSPGGRLLADRVQRSVGGERSTGPDLQAGDPQGVYRPDTLLRAGKYNKDN